MADEDDVAGLDAADLLHLCDCAVLHVHGLVDLPVAFRAVEGARPKPTLMRMCCFLHAEEEGAHIQSILC